MSQFLTRLATLSDFARLRVLRLLETSEMSVGELAKVLQLPQSTVSRHLKMLLEGEWVVRRAEGTASMYRLHEGALDHEARELWDVAKRQLGDNPTLDEDQRRLNGILAERRTDSSEFFGRIGDDWVMLRDDLFGGSFTREAMMALIPEDSVVADLGCGTGDAAEQLAPFVATIVAVDREPAMLAAARRRLAPFDNVEFHEGDLNALPLKDASVDAALMLLVIHHIADPVAAVAEAARILRPGGTFLLVDMVSHDRDSYRHTMGHQHLGFDEDTVRAWAAATRLTDVRYRHLRPDPDGKGPGLFVATMKK